MGTTQSGRAVDRRTALQVPADQDGHNHDGPGERGASNGSLVRRPLARRDRRPAEGSPQFATEKIRGSFRYGSTRQRATSDLVLRPDELAAGQPARTGRPDDDGRFDRGTDAIHGSRACGFRQSPARPVADSWASQEVRSAESHGGNPPRRDLAPPQGGLSGARG